MNGGKRVRKKAGSGWAKLEDTQSEFMREMGRGGGGQRGGKP